MITGSFGSATSDPGPPMTDPQHRRVYRTTPDRTEHHRVCPTGWNGRPPRILPRAERNNATHATPSRMEEHRAFCAGQNGGPPRTPGHTKHNGTPMPRRAEQNTTAHTAPRQTEQNTVAHTGPRQTGRKTSTYAAPGGSEDRHTWRPRRKGRTLRRPCCAERKTTAHAAPG